MGKPVIGNPHPALWFPGVNDGVWGQEIGAGRFWFDDNLAAKYPARLETWSPLVKYLWLEHPNGLAAEPKGAELVASWHKVRADARAARPSRCGLHDPVKGFGGVECKQLVQAAPEPKTIKLQKTAPTSNEVSTLPPEPPRPYVSKYQKELLFWDDQVRPKWGKVVAERYGYNIKASGKSLLLHGGQLHHLTLNEITGHWVKYVVTKQITALQGVRIAARLGIDKKKLNSKAEWPLSKLGKAAKFKSGQIVERWEVIDDFPKLYKQWIDKGAPLDIDQATKTAKVDVDNPVPAGEDKTPAPTSPPTPAQTAAGEGASPPAAKVDDPAAVAGKIDNAMLIAAAAVVAAAVAAKGS